MARKTIQGLLTTGTKIADDTQLLASTLDMSQLQYEYQCVTHEEDVSMDKPEPEPAFMSGLPAVGAQLQAPLAVEMPVQGAHTTSDLPLQGSDIVRAIIARKLRRPISEISVSRSLKELCNGKSTLQNELVGDLSVEFGNLPYNPEDLPLVDLGDMVIPPSATGVTLGKTCSLALNKLVSSKMPPGFDIKTIRSYLSEHWGMKRGRQDAILLITMTSEPETRLTSEKAVHHYLNGITLLYAAWSGITLQAPSALNASQQPDRQPLDPSVAAGYLASSRELARKHHEALAEYLEIRQDTAGPNANDATVGLQAKLDSWANEYSHEFLDWITPMFTPLKTRKYDAYWRSARQEVLQLHHLLTATQVTKMIRDTRQFADMMPSIVNKADRELLRLVQSLSRSIDSRQQDHVGIELKAQWRTLEEVVERAIDVPPRAHPSIAPRRPMTVVEPGGEIRYLELLRDNKFAQLSYADLVSREALRPGSAIMSRAVVRMHQRGDWPIDMPLTEQMLSSFRNALSDGMSFAGKQVLVTGAGRNSIGAEMVRLLLSGGARVIVTTSRQPSSVAQFYQRMYEADGARGSELIVLPFNQASAADCNQLVKHIYSTDGLNRDLDAFLPFAAASERGVQVDGLGSRSELLHRLMLTNVLRLLGQIITQKRSRGINCNPTQVLLPLSPNHGTFGGDGLYSESKLGLESLLRRAQSESWQDELSICGVKIGWTRSTGLMDANDTVAEAIERCGVLTFSVNEMALNIVILLTQSARDLCEERGPIFDFSGGLGQLENCHAVVHDAREAIRRDAAIFKALKEEDDREHLLRSPESQSAVASSRSRTSLDVGFPSLPDYDQEIQPLQRALGAEADPASTIVVVGYSELGPYGSARARWAWESQGHFSRAALTELAWMMGLITHVDEALKDGHYVGWIDCETRQPVADDDIEQRYVTYICDHTGIRQLESEASGYDPNNKETLEEVSASEDLPAFETSSEVASAFKRRHGEQVQIIQQEDGERLQVKFKKGASIMIPKASKFAWGSVAGQLPLGFDATKYGIPKDLVKQLDPVSLYALCCVAEAFYSAGMPNPLEVFRHIHVSEIGNFIGTSMGGALKTKNLYKDVFMGKSVDSDTLQDTYANTSAAWVNMLLLGSTGPIKTPVGACATGVESIDSGSESILSGKTRMCIVGGVDDLQEDEANGFALLKATANAQEEFTKGRLPSEMSRPTAESRSGFVESHGAGVQLLCRADLALEMGLPIYAIVAGSVMAADGVSRSVPAPGQGILGFAKETGQSAAAGVSMHSDEQRATIVADLSRASSRLSPRNESIFSTSTSQSNPDAFHYETPVTPSEDSKQASEEHDLGLSRTSDRSRPQQPIQRSDISPLREALARWGLSVDDLGMASLHGTSTKANDINEPSVICAQMDHLKRTPGRPMWAVCQKSMTGHPKAPAAAWMLNGCLQALHSGVVPGNRTADNIDPAWQKYDHLCLPTSSVAVDLRAFTLTSFGFGQKGGQIIGVAPKYLFATQTPTDYVAYAQRMRQRCAKADREYAAALMNNKIVRVLTVPPWSRHDAHAVTLDPEARMNAEGTITSQTSALPPTDMSTFAQRLVQQLQTGEGALAPWRGKDVSTIGIDMVRATDFSSHLNETFIERNYTQAEVSWARRQTDRRSAFASRWSAKEAVFKCLQTPSQGAGAPMRSIEIITRQGGVPTVSVSAINNICDRDQSC